jgi:hypothetical protein
MSYVTLKGLNSDDEEVQFQYNLNEFNLDLENNKIKSIDLNPLTDAKQLRRLSLTNNKIESIDLSPIAHCENLSYLFLNINELEYIDLSPLRHCKEFASLFLAGNRLKAIDLEPLGECLAFSVLDLKYNFLTEIDLSPLNSCEKLRSIQLDGNEINFVDLEPIKNLTDIDLTLKKGVKRSGELEHQILGEDVRKQRAEYSHVGNIAKEILFLFIIPPYGFYRLATNYRGNRKLALYYLLGAILFTLNHWYVWYVSNYPPDFYLWHPQVIAFSGYIGVAIILFRGMYASWTIPESKYK